MLATGIAIGATVPPATRWDRKNYFYPDLPKGYQISQYDLPLASNGTLTFDTSGGPRTIRIRRAHLEEDTARLIHATDPDGRKVSLIDFDRSGMPLMEIVTEPDVRTAEEARRYAEELQRLLRYIGASDADMEHGQMRVEANVSLRPRGIEPFGTRVEVKNMNSFRSVERAIEFEIERQAAALDAGETLQPGDAGLGRHARRHVRHALEGGLGGLPLLPGARPPAAAHRSGMAGGDRRDASRSCPPRGGSRYADGLGLSPHDVGLLTASRETSDYFDAAVVVASAGETRRRAKGHRELDHGRAHAPRERRRRVRIATASTGAGSRRPTSSTSSGSSRAGPSPASSAKEALAEAFATGVATGRRRRGTRHAPDLRRRRDRLGRGGGRRREPGGRRRLPRRARSRPSGSSSAR